MAELIYALCALTALACAVLLLLAARRTRSRMLFWSALCFGGFALTNGMIVADDLRCTPYDLWTPRLLVALGSVIVLLYGLIVEER
jgi:hypothetical protein